MIGTDKEGIWVLAQDSCPSCNRLILHLEHWGDGGRGILKKVLIRPKSASRSPVPAEVPVGIADDYKEASLVLADSPKASAALSRRCLQSILREKGGVKERDLAKEIQKVLDSGQLPSYLADDLDAVRHIGNFAAHPIKSQNTGEVLPVEPGEAEWNLDVIESLFDFYFVAPSRAQARRDALNKKLDDAGKPPMKPSGT